MKTGKNILELLRKTESHYTRMIDAVDKFPQDEKSNLKIMEVRIGENWSEKYCPFCSVTSYCDNELSWHENLNKIKIVGNINENYHKNN